MNIKNLYDKYDIMPQLVKHQLRVAGIGKIITDSWTNKSIAREAVIACLLHDMGNIVKFVGLTDPYWLEIQKKYRQEYSEDAHEATYGILEKEGLTKYVGYLKEEAKLYAKIPVLKDFEQTSKPAMIVLYGDMRVAMNGVVTLKERTLDLTTRYGAPRPENKWGDMLEKYIQTLTDSDIRAISEKDVSPFFDDLLTIDL